jgi:hypothetical protein
MGVGLLILLFVIAEVIGWGTFCFGVGWLQDTYSVQIVDVWSAESFWTFLCAQLVVWGIVWPLRDKTGITKKKDKDE